MEYNLLVPSIVLMIIGILYTLFILGDIMYDCYKLDIPWYKITHKWISYTISIIITLAFGVIAFCGPDTIYIGW